VTSLIGAN